MTTLIGLSGWARSGKDTVAERLGLYGFKRRAFADHLKYAAAVIFGFSNDQLYGDAKDVVDPHWGFTPRHALETLGEAQRAAFGEDIWIRSLLCQPLPKKTVISDVRYPNEANAILAMGGEVWRIERRGLESISDHASQHALDHYPSFTAVLENGDICELRATVAAQVDRLKGNGENPEACPHK